MADNKIVNGVAVPLTADDLAEMAARDAAFQAQKAAYAKVAYLDQRKEEYPSIQDQLLAIWNSMDSGEIPQSKAFYNAIKAVNDKYPAPAVV
jgi:hypothetical protein